MKFVFNIDANPILPPLAEQPQASQSSKRELEN